MSIATSVTTRFDNRSARVAPEVAGSDAPSTPTPPLSRRDSRRLRELVEQMHQSVVRATEVTDRATKTQLWDAYRSARAEALAMLVPCDGREISPNTRPLRSV